MRHSRIGLCLLLALLALCPVLSAQAPDDQARRITERPEYRGYRVEKPPGYEPSGGDGSVDGGSGNGASGRGTGVRGPRRGSGSTGPERGSGGGSGGGSGSGLSAPAWIGALFQVVAWVILAAGVVIALYFIVKALLGIKFKGRAKSQKSKHKKAKAAVETEATSEAPIVLDEKVFEDALEQALRDYQQALANEDYAAATLLAYRIFWLRAGWRGCVESADVRTWRDALRMVRAPETRQDVRALLPMVERVRYADYRPHKGEFNSWSLNLEKIEPAGVLS